MVSVSSQTSSFFCAAIVASAHGLQGHVKVKCFLEDPCRFKAYSPFSNEQGEPIYKVKKILSQNQATLLVSLEGVVDRTEAERLRGTKLMLDPKCLPNLSEDLYYHKDLIGLSVLSPKGTILGTVHALYNFGAGDLLEVKALEEVLCFVPFTHEMVPEVNLEKGFLCLSESGELFLREKSDGA